MTILYILLAIFVFGILIFIHELGHFLAARACGVTVHEFAIGMGPKLVWYQSKKSGTVYSLRMFPFGGFVSMLGEGDEEAPEGAALAVGEGSLAAKPAWQRLIVNAAGAAMNLLFGFLVMGILTLTTPLVSTTVLGFYETEQTSSADQGLMEDDKILSVNGKRVHIGEQLVYEIMHDGDEPVELVVERDGERHELTVQFPTMEESGQTFGDPDFYVYGQTKTVGSFFSHAFFKCVYVVDMIWESIFDLFTGRYGMEAVSGPVGTGNVIAEATRTGGLYALANITVIISINLGIFNLLPLPALDGGHILLNLVEIVTRKKVPQKISAIVDAVGLLLLLLLMVVVTFKDIFMLF